jgi:hypothetical protein
MNLPCSCLTCVTWFLFISLFFYSFKVNDSVRFSKAGLSSRIFEINSLKLNILKELVTTIAGSASGLKDGDGVNASFQHPRGMF